MAELSIVFKTWRKFHAEGLDMDKWAHEVARESVRIFQAAMTAYPPASSPGEFPHSRSGRVRGSIKGQVSGNAVIISTSAPYSTYLRTGTSRMGARKMSDAALAAGIASVRMKIEGGWRAG